MSIVILLVINLIIIFQGLLKSFRKGSYFIFIWFYLLYFCVLYANEGLSDTYHFLEWSSSQFSEKVTYENKLEYYLFITLVNVSIFIGVKFDNSKPFTGILETGLRMSFLKQLLLFFSILLVFSLLSLLSKLQSYDYTSLTSSSDFGGWPWVFFQVSTSIIVLGYFLKNKYVYIFIFLGSTIYLFLTLVRSIFLFSIGPLLFLYLTNLLSKNIKLNILIKRFGVIMSVLFVLVFLSTKLRTNNALIFPESKAVSDSYYIYQANLANDQNFNGQDFVRFFNGFLIPIKKLVDQEITKYKIQSTPEKNASVLFKGYVDILDLESFHHYPVIFYNTFFSCFGWYSVVLGFILAKYFILLEKSIRKNILSLILFLPIFSWHTFMVLRGAIDISSSGIAYALCINIILFLILKHLISENTPSNK